MLRCELYVLHSSHVSIELHHQGVSVGVSAMASSEGLELLKANNMAIPGNVIQLIDTVGKGIGVILFIIL